MKIKKDISQNQKKKLLVNKESLISAIYYQITGALLCLAILFYLSGGKNYIKLYKELNKVIDTYDTITKNNYSKVDKKDLTDVAINAMLESVEDKYTNYSDEEETNTFIQNVEGYYEGIGITVKTDKNGKIIIVTVFDNSPAKEAGLKANDIITKINGEDLTGKTSNDLVDYIKDNKNKKIKLTVLRNEQEKEITITTNKVTVPTVSSKIIDEENKIGYIKITIFSSVTETQFKKELESLEKKKINALIIDVRNNSGGYLNVVTNISSMFLTKGKVIYQLQDDSKTTKIKDKTSEKRTYPVAIVTNRASASASEILAGAMKESYNAIVVGTNTYGKGTVQKTKKLQDGSMIKYTIEKWLTPSGKWIEEVGISPTEYIEYDSSKNIDNQLDKTIELLKEKIQ